MPDRQLDRRLSILKASLLPPAAELKIILQKCFHEGKILYLHESHNYLSEQCLINYERIIDFENIFPGLMTIFNVKHEEKQQQKF